MKVKYTITQFNIDFPDEATCLEYIFKKRYPRAKGYYRITTRPVYVNQTGHQINPLAGTIFRKSSTPLRLWFFAIYLFSQSRHGVSAAELQRQIGVTYKTAWRMCHLIRGLMKDGNLTLSGTVECDEAYIGGKRRLAVRRTDRNKTPVFGIVQRGGKVHAEPVNGTGEYDLYPIIHKRVKNNTRVITDGYTTYQVLKHSKRYRHKSVNHSKWEYVRVEGRTKIHTNTIEGFWSHLKRGINGTHHSVSKQHLASYVNESAFRYNHRGELLFPILLDRAV